MRAVLSPAYGGPLDAARRASHLPILDGLRGLAALSVVLYHFDERRFPFGAFGVLVFFVLSGFLITWLLCAEQERTGTLSLGRFYARRSLRLFPAFYAYWMITMVLSLALRWRGGRPFPIAQAVASFFYVGNYYQGLNAYPESGFSHTWSLGVEEQFYLLWPALFIALVRLTLKRRAGVIAVLIGTAWVIRLSLHVLGAPEAYIYTAFETRADQLLVGCLAAVVLRAGLARTLVRALTATPALVLVTLVALGSSVFADAHHGTRYRNTIGFCVEPALVAVLIVQLTAAHRHPLARWLDGKTMVFLGALSYSIYLYQQLVLYFVPKLFPSWLPFVARLSISIAVTVLVVWISYRLVEAPFNKLRARFAS